MSFPLTKTVGTLASNVAAAPRKVPPRATLPPSNPARSESAYDAIRLPPMIGGRETGVLVFGTRVLTVQLMVGAFIEPKMRLSCLLTFGTISSSSVQNSAAPVVDLASPRTNCWLTPCPIPIGKMLRWFAFAFANLVMPSDLDTAAS